MSSCDHQFLFFNFDLFNHLFFFFFLGGGNAKCYHASKQDKMEASQTWTGPGPSSSSTIATTNHLSTFVQLSSNDNSDNSDNNHNNTDCSNGKSSNGKMPLNLPTTNDAIKQQINENLGNTTEKTKTKML